MGKIKLKGKDLRKINYSSNRSIALAIDLMAKHYKHASKEAQIEILCKIKENHHSNYLEDEIFGILAEEFSDKGYGEGSGCDQGIKSIRWFQCIWQKVHCEQCISANGNGHEIANSGKRSFDA